MLIPFLEGGLQVWNEITDSHLLFHEQQLLAQLINVIIIMGFFLVIVLL